MRAEGLGNWAEKARRLGMGRSAGACKMRVLRERAVAEQGAPPPPPPPRRAPKRRRKNGKLLAEEVEAMTNKMLRAECRRVGVTQNNKSSADMIHDLKAWHAGL